MTESIEVTAEVIEPTNELQVTMTPAIFQDNLGALEAYVDQQIEPYIGAEFDPADEQGIKIARGIMADLNKLKAPIEDERKRIKRAYEAPLKDFEARVKHITSKIDDARNGIKASVDKADEAFRETRFSLLCDAYYDFAGEIANVITPDAVIEQTWLNRSTAESKALKSMEEKAEKAIKGYTTLMAKELRHKDEVVRRYVETLDMVAALEYEDELNARDAEMEAFKAAQEAAEAAKAAQLHQVLAEPQPTPQIEPQIMRWALSMEFEGDETLARTVAQNLKSLGITGATIKCLGVVDHD